MQLPDFIKRALAFFDKAEANQTAAAELAAAKNKIIELEGLRTKDSETASANQKTQADALAAKEAEITKLTGQVEAEKKRANETLAKAGVTAEALPQLETSSSPGTAKESAWSQYEKLIEKDPAAAGRFYAENADAILKSRPQK